MKRHSYGSAVCAFFALENFLGVAEMADAEISKPSLELEWV